MMPLTDQPDTDELLDLAALGDREASSRLFDRHRDQLRKMIAVRLDSRLTARLDPSDVVQETLIQASRRLPKYLEDRAIPFYPWLRRIALDRLNRVHKQHLDRGNRRVDCEEPMGWQLSNESLLKLAGRFIAKNSSPSRQSAREELRERVRKALEFLKEQDRELLILRFLEQLSIKEVADVLGISEGAVNMRQLRALDRLRKLLDLNAEEYDA
jgi:RNA polymerase sigma-70 factor, ECF subfamily